MGLTISAYTAHGGWSIHMGMARGGGRLTSKRLEHIETLERLGALILRFSGTRHVGFVRMDAFSPSPYQIDLAVLSVPF